MAIEWTEETPTEVGWYWYDYQGDPIKVMENSCGDLFVASSYTLSGTESVHDRMGKWAGPLVMPK